MKLHLLVVILSAFVVGTSAEAGDPPAPPARCAVSSFEIESKRSAAIFVGVVKEVEKDGDTKTFTFEVERFWKGDGAREIKVNVYENPRFQAQFVKHGRFLVFAKPDGEEGENGLMDGRCSRTKDLDRFPEGAKEDLDRLGKGKKPE